MGVDEFNVGSRVGVQEIYKVAVIVGVVVREGVAVSVHVGIVRVVVTLAVSEAVVAVDEGRMVSLAVLVTVGVFVEVAGCEGVGETISMVDEAVTSFNTKNG